MKKSCENCECGSFGRYQWKCDGKEYITFCIRCYSHPDCTQDEPVVIFEDEYEETAEKCPNYEKGDSK